MGDAFRALITEWNCFKPQPGSATNKRVVAANDAIPEALWEIYEAETGTDATREDTVTESSDRPDGGD